MYEYHGWSQSVVPLPSNPHAYIGYAVSMLCCDNYTPISVVYLIDWGAKLLPTISAVYWHFFWLKPIETIRADGIQFPTFIRSTITAGKHQHIERPILLRTHNSINISSQQQKVIKNCIDRTALTAVQEQSFVNTSVYCANGWWGAGTLFVWHCIISWNQSDSLLWQAQSQVPPFGTDFQVTLSLCLQVHVRLSDYQAECGRPRAPYVFIYSSVQLPCWRSNPYICISLWFQALEA